MNLAILSSEIDIETTLDRLCSDEALLLEVLDMFVVEFREGHADLLNHIEQADFDWVAKKAHYYKGIAQNLELLRFLPEIKQLEHSAKAGDSTGCHHVLQALLQTVNRIDTLRSGIQPG